MSEKATINNVEQRPSEVILTSETELGSQDLNLQPLQISPSMNVTNVTQNNGSVPSPSPSKTQVQVQEQRQKKTKSLTPPRIRIGGLSGIKEKPVCNVPALRKENMSAEQLSLLCFKPEEILMDVDQSTRSDDEHENKSTNGENNSCLGNATIEKEDEEEHSFGHADVLKEGDGHIHMDTITNTHSTVASPEQWASLKQSILNRTESRNGRDLQRFATGSGTATGTTGIGTGAHSGGQLFRLTTGSVPIMSDGKILLVSSSRKEEWILPKGGWELDESLEVSALRETYEEGGILGIVGPRLTEIEYETRKGRKRRLEMEASLKKKYEPTGSIDGNTNGNGHGNGNASAVVSTPSANSSTCPSEEGECVQTSAPIGNPSLAPTGSRNISHVSSGNHNGLVGNIHSEQGGQDNASLGSIASITSDGSAYCGHVRMYMFPMYVLEVREQWPESGRARKVVDIDTAIEIMSSRPEFHKVLLEVKEHGYHLRPCVGPKSQHSDLQSSCPVVI